MSMACPIRMCCALAEHYMLHPLAVEDVLHVHQRPKVESYGKNNGGPAHLFIVVRMPPRRGRT